MTHTPHPEMQPILAEMLSAPMPDYTKMPMAEARAMFDRNAANWNRPLPDVPARDVVLGGVACRVIQPDATGGAIVFSHGGGWTFGSPTSHDRSGRLPGRLRLAPAVEELFDFVVVPGARRALVFDPVLDAPMVAIETPNASFLMTAGEGPPPPRRNDAKPVGDPTTIATSIPYTSPRKG